MKNINKKKYEEIKNYLKPSIFKIDLTQDEKVKEYTLSILTNIKNYIKNYINVDKIKEAEIDIKMENVIIYAIAKNDSSFEELLNNLTMYYVAIYYDNLSLYNKMVQKDINFKKYSNPLAVYLLDSSITSKFAEDEYIEIVKYWDLQFLSFYQTIKDLPTLEREKYIERVAAILKKLQPKARKYLEDYKTRTGVENISFNELLFNTGLLSKNTLDSFSDITYFEATLNQLELMSYIGEKNYSNIVLSKLNHLIQTTEFFHLYSDYELMFRLFSDEELLNISCFDSQNIEYYSKYLNIADNLLINMQRNGMICGLDEPIIYKRTKRIN